MSAATNGKEVSPDNAHPANSTWFRPTWYKPLGQSLELLSVVSLTSVLAFLQMQNEWKGLMIASAILIAVMMFVAAVVMAQRDATEAAKKKQTDGKKKHIVSEFRLKILTEIKAPGDVIFCLTQLITPKPTPDTSSSNGNKEVHLGTLETTAEELISKLRMTLGNSRTDEVKDMVLRYTDLNEHIESKANEPAAPVAPAGSSTVVATVDKALVGQN